MFNKLKIFTLIGLFLMFIISCGSSSGTSIVDTLKQDSLTRSVIILKNASKSMIQSMELAKKLIIYKEEDLPDGLDCTTLGFTKINRDVNISLVEHSQYTNNNLSCEIYDYKNFDKDISGELNKIFILK